MLLWAGAAPVATEIYAYIGDRGVGLFSLHRLIPTNGSWVTEGMRMDDSNKRDGDAVFGFTGNQIQSWDVNPISLRISVFSFAKDKTKLPLYISVRQNNRVLKPIDMMGDPVTMTKGFVLAENELVVGQGVANDFNILLR